MARVLITGGAGFIGANLCLRLLKEGHEVTSYDDYSNASGKTLIEQISNIGKVRASVLDSITLGAYIRESDLVFNLAVRSLPESLEDPFSVHMTNDIGTFHVAYSCSRQKKRLVHVSTSEVYGTALTFSMAEEHPLNGWTTPYGASKVAAEMVVKGFQSAYGLEAVIVRPFNAYGPGMREDTYSAVIPRFVSASRRGSPLPIQGDGKQTRDMTFVDDTVEGIFLAGDIFPLGETFNIARGDEISVLDMASAIRAYYGNSALQERPPRTGDLRRHFADITKARKILGFEPKVDFKDGIKKYIEWYNSVHPSIEA